MANFNDRLYTVFSLDLTMYLVRQGFDIINARPNYVKEKEIVFRFEKNDELIKAIEEYKES